MRVFKVNILSKNVLNSADAICFTSNGMTKKDGRLVMGAGVAKQFRDTFPNLDQEAGTAVKTYGHRCQTVRQMMYLGNSLNIISFPTKYDWKDKSDIKLIKRSAMQLMEMTNKYGWKAVYLPAPGVSNGGLSWENEVKPLLIKMLDNRFIITFLPKG